MAKKNMQMRYKSKKRERNKIEVTKQDEAKSILKTIAMVLVFLGVMYLMMMGLEKIGVFEKGYSAIPGAMAQPINSWSEFRKVLRQLKDPQVQEKFETV